MDRAPRHHVMVDFQQHQERVYVVLEEDHIKVEKERDEWRAKYETLYVDLAKANDEALEFVTQRNLLNSKLIDAQALLVKVRSAILPHWKPTSLATTGTKARIVAALDAFFSR